VRSGSPAELAEPPIKGDDVLKSIDGQPVKDLASLIARYEEIMRQETLPEHLLLEFDRAGKNQITLIKPKPDKDEDPPREVGKAWIGVAVQPVVTKLAAKLGKPDALGFRVTRVYPRTVAAETGLAVGDIILSLNGNRLKPKGVQDSGMFHREVRKLDVDGSAKVTVLRGDREEELAVRLEQTRITPEEARRDRNREFELSVRELTFFDRDENRWDDSVQGVIVQQVESAGWAQLGGIGPGDLIQRIDHRIITGLADYRIALEEITRKKPDRVVFVVLRGVRTHFQYIEPDWTPGDVSGEEAGEKQE